MVSVLKSLTSLFFPEICYACGSDLVNAGQMICLRCRSDLPFTNFAEKRGNPVEKIFWGRIDVAKAGSLVYFSKDTIVAKLLHQLKYKGKKEVGELFGRMIGEAMQESQFSHEIDLIIPLPLFRKKERLRGFNQATVICNGISSIIQKPVETKAVGRISYTETQTQKGRLERWENMQDRFNIIDSSLIEGKHVLLVDDVITTGATLEACGSKLLEIPGTRVSIFTFAYSSSTGYF